MRLFTPSLCTSWPQGRGEYAAPKVSTKTNLSFGASQKIENLRLFTVCTLHKNKIERKAGEKNCALTAEIIKTYLHAECLKKTHIFQEILVEDMTILKYILKKQCWGCGLDPSGTRYGLVADRVNRTLGSHTWWWISWAFEKGHGSMAWFVS